MKKHRLVSGGSVCDAGGFGLLHLVFRLFIAIFVLTRLIVALLCSNADTMYKGVRHTQEVEFVES